MIAILTEHNKYKIPRKFSFLIFSHLISFVSTHTIFCEERIVVKCEAEDLFDLLNTRDKEPKLENIFETEKYPS
jgi:hypothetical protein